MYQFPPLQFHPILREYLWGGRRLAELGKPIGDGPHYAESWEVVDHGDDQSVVAGGPFDGRTLHEMVMTHGQELFGKNYPQRQFPLLFKFLDCQRTLSVQVHPNDEQAARLEPPDLGKTEAWVVLAAEPGSTIYAGLKSGVDRTALEQAVAAGRCDECLHQFEPRAGDCVFIEAGTVHALGAGLLVAEIQQASDTTYRLFDWNRVDKDGKPRALHVQQALAVIDFSRGPVAPIRPQRTERPYVERLIGCDKFVLDRWRLDEPQVMTIDGRAHILAAIDGSLSLDAASGSDVLQRGSTTLVPASCEQVRLIPQGTARLLSMRLP